MDKIKSIFNYEKKDIIERDPGLYRWEKKPYVKDDVKVLNNLLHKLLKKNRSDTCRFKDEKHFFGSSLVKSNYKKKENNQRVMFKMSYSNSMRQHFLTPQQTVQAVAQAMEQAQVFLAEVWQVLGS